MSAFMLGSEHFNALANAAVQPFGPGREPLSWWHGGELHRASLEAGQEIVDMLAAENRRSLAARYGERAAKKAAGKGPWTFACAWRAPEPLRVLRAVACYEYQACESPDWDSTQARAFCDALRRFMIAAMPGYGDWDGLVTDARQVMK